MKQACRRSDSKRYKRHNSKPPNNSLRRAANELLADPGFLFRASEQIEAEGLVGEENNGLIIFLAPLTATFPDPVSVMVKAPSTSGKSTITKFPLRLLPQGMILPRSSYSSKALVYGKEPLAGKVIYLAELRGGKEAQYLLRLLQSDAAIARELAIVIGRERRTQLVERTGSPCVITTTTEKNVFDDDATRFLIISADQTEEQTSAILLAKLKSQATPEARQRAVSHQRAVFRKAVEILREYTGNIEFPDWFETVAKHVPRTLRSRRDWPRFLSLCRAIALIRFHRSSREKTATIMVSFEDYAVAYRLLNRAFSKTASTGKSPTDQLVAAVESLYKKASCGISTDQLRNFLRWERPTIYKHIEKAVDEGRLRYESGSRRNNEKRLIPNVNEHGDFLISPRALLRRHPDLKGCNYVDPITGKKTVIGAVTTK